MRQVLGLIGIVGALAGCNNPCQQICNHMADYAEECGFSVPPEQVDACMERQSAGLEGEDRAACRDFGDPEVIRAQWDCAELEQYWTSGGTSPTDTL